MLITTLSRVQNLLAPLSALVFLVLLTSFAQAQEDYISCAPTCPDDVELSCNDSTDPAETGYPSITCTYPCGGGCSLTYGYWKTHSEFGPAPYDDTWAQLPDGASTEFFTTGESWHTILWTPPAGGNAYLKLAHQWIAVHMNMLNGASTPVEVAEGYAAGQQLLEDYAALIYIPNGPDKAAANQIASLLDSYNNGDIGPGHCDDGNSGDGGGDGSTCEEVVDADWTFSDESSGDCPIVIVRTWSTTIGDNTYTCEQTLTVSDDVPPVLGDLPEDQTGLCDQPIDPAEVSATDNCDDDVDVTVEESSEGEGCNYVITFTYTATDDCGNTDTGSYSVSVVDDTPPTLNGAPEDDTVECDSVPAPAEVTASDNCDDDVEVEYSEESNPSGCNYVLMRTWTATDDCGNSVSHTQVILVIDTTAPELFGVPEDTSLDCDDEIPDAIVFATDNCDDEVIVNLTAETTPQPCGYLLVRTWTTVDDCGNEASESQTITVIDTFDPEVTNPIEAEITRACDDDSPTDVPTFEDSCDEDLTITSTSETLNDDGCEYDVLNTWTAEDDCGNSVTVSQLIHYVDDEAPELSDYPDNMVVDCESGAPEPPVLTVSDNCDDSVELMFEETIGDDGDEGCQLIQPASPYYDPAWAIWLQDLPEEYQFYQLTSGTWTELPDGSIHIQGTTVSTANPNGGWIIDVMLQPGMDWPTWQSQPWPNWYKDDFNDAGDNYLDWIYFLFNNDASTLTGWGDFEGSHLTLVHAPSSMYYGYQLGIAANNVNSEYGSGGWFGYEGTLMDSSTGYDEFVEALGDFAFNHDCCDEPPVTWTWTAEDCAGNSVSHTVTVTFVGGNNIIEGIVANEPINCTSDFDHDGYVTTGDMLVFLEALGCMEDCTIDLNGDGKTDSADMLKFLTEYGSACQ